MIFWKQKYMWCIYLNEIIIEDEILLEPQEMINFQTKGNRNVETNENNF